MIIPDTQHMLFLQISNGVSAVAGVLSVNASGVLSNSNSFSRPKYIPHVL
jgi:hypothetical protein